MSGSRTVCLRRILSRCWSLGAAAGLLMLLPAVAMGQPERPKAATPSAPPGAATGLASPQAPAGAIALESLDLSSMTQEWGQAHAARSVDDHPITLGGTIYPRGVGTHAGGEFAIELHSAGTRFESDVGVDDETKGKGSVVFEVWVDGRLAHQTGVLRGGQAAEHISVDLAGARQLVLIVTDGGDGIDHDHADWAGAVLYLRPDAKEKPTPAAVADEPAQIDLSVIKPPDQPAIHAPRVTGGSPGRAFLFRIPATGQGPLRFGAAGLPDGLALDPATGIISGSIASPGMAKVRVSVEGPAGSATGTVTIVGEPGAVARTPPMGWNSWNVWAGAVDDKKVRDAADWLVKSGLAAHGFQYVNIDDTWEGTRDADGRIGSNKKFPDMKALADYVHGKGLKLGIYSSPGPKTCAGFEGSYQHEALDAQTYAAWGIDLLKYDWCSYGGIAPHPTLAEMKRPYEVMRGALDGCGRDIVYSLCQYGMGKVWEWGGRPGADEGVGGNYWRTTGDITDTWSSMSGIGFGQAGHEAFAGPGHWNDPDMLVVGRLGWGPSVRPTHLTQNEQVTHITLWALLAAPLLIGCDLTQLDDFTLALLCNPEVLEVSQDPLGKQARRVRSEGGLEVWARPLADGTVAVGLFNRNRSAARVTATWADLGLADPEPVRNVWLRHDVGTSDGSYSADVPRHGAVMVRIGTPKGP